MDIAAPGVDVLSTFPTNGCQICDRLDVVQYGVISGTSMATPHVAGVAALLRAEFPDVSAAEIADTLLETAVPLGSDDQDNSYGNGLVQAVAALELLSGGTIPSNPNPSPPSPSPPTNPIPSPQPIPPSNPPANGDCEPNFLKVDLSLRTDDKGAETYWWIMRERDNYPVALGTRLEATTQYDYSDCLPSDCYTLSIFDGGENGICCDFGDGAYSLRVNGSMMVDSESDPDSFGSSVSHSFGNCSASPVSGCVEVSVVIRTDDYPDENSLLLIDQSDGSSVWSESFTEKQTDHEFAACLDPMRCYTFVVNDSYNDGLCCGYGQGFVTLSYDGEVIVDEGSFGNSLSASIGNCA